MDGIGNNWMAVINPHAGSGRTMNIWEDVRPYLGEKGIFFHEKYTSAKGDAVSIAREACAKGYRRFIAVGGDGTAHEVLNGILCFLDGTEEGKLSDFTLAVIPVGSGNDWLRSHGIPNDAHVVADHIARGSFGYQDIARVTDGEGKVTYMLNIGGVGIDARVCELVNARKDEGKYGKLLYVSALLRTFSVFRPKMVEVVLDGVTAFKGRFLSIALGIGRFCGGGMIQCPGAKFDDGLLDVTVIPAEKTILTLFQAWRLFTGSFDKVKHLTFGKCRRVDIRPIEGEGELVESDGETVALLPVSIEIIGPQIRVVTANPDNR